MTADTAPASCLLASCTPCLPASLPFSLTPPPAKTTGAVGFGPMTYALPTCLYMVAFRHKLSRREWCGNAAFVAFWLLTSLTAAVGAMYSIVSSASTYRFFS